MGRRDAKQERAIISISDKAEGDRVVTVLYTYWVWMMLPIIELVARTAGDLGALR